MTMKVELLLDELLKNCKTEKVSSPYEAKRNTGFSDLFSIIGPIPNDLPDTAP